MIQSTQLGAAWVFRVNRGAAYHDMLGSIRATIRLHGMGHDERSKAARDILLVAARLFVIPFCGLVHGLRAWDSQSSLESSAIPLRASTVRKLIDQIGAGSSEHKVDLSKEDGEGVGRKLMAGPSSLKAAMECMAALMQT
eukprot:4375604-Pyramimonas_sp.AAC.1